MTSRERVLRAVNHEEPDRVPIDFGGSFVTSIHQFAYENLKRYLNFEAPTVIIRKRALVVQVDTTIMDRFGVDTRLARLRDPDGRHTRYHDDGSVEDEWGVRWYRPPDADAYYIKYAPLENVDDIAALERYPWPEPYNPERVRELAEEVASLRDSGKAIVLNLAYEFVTQSRFMRGFENWMADLILNSGFAAGLMDRILEIYLTMAEDVLAAVGDKIDIIYIADDLAMQTGPLFSPEIYRRLIKPRQKRLVQHLKKHSSAKILYHSCGAVHHFLPDLIEIGIDIINPVQVSAEGMDTRKLKKEFGRDITFWGAIDTQRVLPFGTPQEVREEVKRRIEDLAPGGGFVLAAVHNIRPEVPPENIIAMLEAALEYGAY